MAFFGGGCKYAEQVMNHSKVAYSVMFCCSAAGDLVPPMVIFKSQNGALYESWCGGGPAGAVYGATKSGWFDMEKFNQWFSMVRMYNGSKRSQFFFYLLKNLL